MTTADLEPDGITVRLPAELPVLTRQTARILLGILVELTTVEVLDGRTTGSLDDC